MEIKKRILKIKTDKIAKKSDFPKDFSNLILKIRELITLNDPNKRYQIIDEKSKNEIKNEEDFQKMSNEYINENIIKLTVNVVDKNTLPVLNKKPETNIISNIEIINILGNKKEEEENKENELENPMKSIIKEKMKELEDKLVEELYNNLQNEISKSKINKNNDSDNENEKNMNKMIHKGITCNRCQMKNIQGIRYKCAQCANYNLCENCENNFNHDMKHIMVKLRYPSKNENELKSKINKNITYKNQNFDYNLEPKIFIFEGDNDTAFHQVKITNTGKAPWKGVTLKCIQDKSEILGEECGIDLNVNSGSSINKEIVFDNLQNQKKPSKNIYYCFFQMFNEQNESFGNVTKIKLQFKN